ncbi:PAS domain-containing sensor histidine kinase [Magnetovibrio sp. PR-2]|uniref:sensor histidine kinase n=1 Tax=Magnetovibrio sp. PR-2 TaxID=3120356 RepID=UPI002FCE5D0E
MSPNRPDQKRPRPHAGAFRPPHASAFRPWHDISTYVVSTAAFVGVFFVIWSMSSALKIQQDYQSSLMENAGISISAEISSFVRERTRQLNLFAEQNATLLYHFMQNGERSLSQGILERLLKKQYPNHFAFTVRGPDGGLFPDDFGQFVGPVCQRDIESFWDTHHTEDLLDPQTLAEGYKPFIHPMANNFHFDMMTLWKMPSGEDAILFVSFYPTEIIRMISRFQLPGHRIVLVHSDRPNLIEMMAEGSRDQLGENVLLSDIDLKTVEHSIPVAHTRWTILVLPEHGFIEGLNEEIHTRALYQILGIALFWIVAMWLIWRDLQQRARNDALIEEQTERLLNSQQIAHVGSWDWDIQTGAISWTDEIYRIFGRSRDDFGATFENFMECIHKDDREAVQAAVDKALRSDEPYKITHRIVRPDGSVGYAQGRAKVYRDKNRKPLRMLGVVHDISERTHLDRSKAAFIAVISHELRTPLTAVKGTLGLLGGGALGQLSDKAQDMLDVASRNADRLIELVNDILDLEKLESGKMEFHFQDIDLADVVVEGIKANVGFAAKHDVKLDTSATLPSAHVSCDRDRIIQVMTNLLSNAVKFSEAGDEVIISIDLTRTYATVKIQDNGPGIPGNLRDDIFDRFTQVDASDMRSKSGTGLGLSISKSIIDAHSGEIHVDSQEGQGSTFCFTLKRIR